MNEPRKPIAWTALARGAVVHTSDGEEIGKVAEVVADEQKDIFSGLAISTGLFDSDRFVPADSIEAMSDQGVVLKLGRNEVSSLPPYEE